MIPDFMSKPLQGSLFKLFRNVIMGWEHTSILFNASSSNEERVENNRNELISGRQSSDGKALERCKAYAHKNETIQFH